MNQRTPGAEPILPDNDLRSPSAGLEARGWQLRLERSPAAQLHERSAALVGGDGPSVHLVRVLEPVGKAIVLGSTQSSAAVDTASCAASGTEVAQRRSGGGAVLVVPGEQLWVDIVLPSGSPLWCDDVGKAAWWLGDTWARALSASGAAGAEVWKGAMRASALSRLVCFAGVGPGEVLGPDGRKWVGISQRRARRGAVLQSACLLAWRPRALVECLALDEREKAAMAVVLTKVAAPAPVSGVALLESFLAALPPV